MYKKKYRGKREKKKWRYLDDLFCLKYIRNTIDEEKKREEKRNERKKEKEAEKDGATLTNRSSVRHSVHEIWWQKRSPFVNSRSQGTDILLAMFDSDNDLWVSYTSIWNKNTLIDIFFVINNENKVRNMFFRALFASVSIHK